MLTSFANELSSLGFHCSGLWSRYAAIGIGRFGALIGQSGNMMTMIPRTHSTYPAAKNVHSITDHHKKRHRTGRGDSSSERA
jgi:hypothetical protein